MNTHLKNTKKMYFKLTANIEKFNGVAGYTGWIEEMPGIVAYGHTKERVKEELRLSLKVKIAYDYKLPIMDVDDGDIDLATKGEEICLAIQ